MPQPSVRGAVAPQRRNGRVHKGFPRSCVRGVRAEQGDARRNIRSLCPGGAK